MSLSNRALLLAGVIALTQLGSRAADLYLSPLPPLPPERELTGLPLTFDGWRGRDLPLGDDVLQNLGATAVVNRGYRNDAGESIAVNVAVFDDYYLGIPHPPLDCYSRAGWELQATRNVRLNGALGRKGQIAIYVLQKRNESLMLAYWCQLGDEIVLDNDSVRRVRRRLRGERLPLMKKVTLQTPLDTAEAAELRLLSLARPVFDAVDAFK